MFSGLILFVLGYRRKVHDKAHGQNILPFLQLISWVFVQNAGPVIITGTTRGERVSVAERYMDVYATNFSNKILWVNCTTETTMAKAFFAMVQSYDIKEAYFKRNLYELIYTIHKYFRQNQTLFVLEEAHIEDRYVRSFIGLGTRNPFADILITTPFKFAKGAHVSLNFTTFRTSNIQNVVNNLRPTLRKQFIDTHRIVNGEIYSYSRYNYQSMKRPRSDSDESDENSIEQSQIVEPNDSALLPAFPRGRNEERVYNILYMHNQINENLKKNQGDRGRIPNDVVMGLQQMDEREEYAALLRHRKASQKLAHELMKRLKNKDAGPKKKKFRFLTVP